MQDRDALLRLLREFFNLPPDVRPQEITQSAVAEWDSLAMVQLIADLQGTFLIDFDLDEIGGCGVMKRSGLRCSKKVSH